MNNQLYNLNQLLEDFLSIADNDKTQASRNLVVFSENQNFLDLAMTFVSTCSPTINKLTLLSIMIKDKFKYDFQLIDSQKIMTYYQILCEFASKFGLTSKPLFSNISQSLALIYLSQIAYRDLPLTDFIKRFQTEDQNQLYLYNYYFKILEQCAFYVLSSKFVLDQDSRSAAKKRLISQQIQIIQILNQCVQIVWYNTIISKVVQKIRIIDCLTTWIDLHYDPQIYNSLHTTSLLREIVNCLTFEKVVKQGQRKQVNQYLDSASLCLKAIIERIQSPQLNSQIYSYLGRACYQLISFIDQRIKNPEDVEELISLVIFFSQKFVIFLVDNYSENTRDFLMSLIRYMNSGLPKIVNCLIQFLQDLLDLFNTRKQQRILPAELKMDMPIAIYLSLVQKCTYPPYLLQKLDFAYQYQLIRHDDEAEQIYDNRVSAQNCFEGLSQLLGPNSYIEYALKNISELEFQDFLYLCNLEVYLFALIPGLRKLTEITQNVENFVLNYQNLIRNKNPLPVAVKRTFLKLFKAIFTLQNLEYSLVRKIYNFIIECLRDQMLVSFAAMTLCRGCQKYPQHFYSMIVEISALVKQHIFEEQIIRGFIYLASYDQKTANFLIQDCLECIISYAKDDFLDSLRSKQCIQTLVSALKAIRDCSFEGKKQILQNFVKISWDYILTTLRSPQACFEDQDIKVERIVKLIKGFMRILKSDFIPYLNQLFTTTTQSFQKYPICSYVYLVQLAITVYAPTKDEEIQNFLKQVYQKTVESTLRHLQKQEIIDTYTYLLDDFLGMNSRLLIYNTKVIVSSNYFPNLIKFITEECLQATSSKAIKATYSFLQTLFMIYWSDQFIQAYNRQDEQAEQDKVTVNIQPKIIDINLYNYLYEYLKAEMPEIIKRMLGHLLISNSEKTRKQILDTLLSQFKAFPDLNPYIWKQILSEISPNILVQAEKEQIIILMENIRNQFNNFEKVRVWMGQLNTYLNLINKRMIIAEKRRKINLKN